MTSPNLAMGFDEAVAKLQEILNGITTPRPAQDIVIAKTVFTALGNVMEECNQADISVLIANKNTNILEEAFMGKFVLSRCLQTMMLSIYEVIIEKAPGYAVRNIALCFVALCSNKAVPLHSRECAMNICAAVMEKRSFDCGSMISDVVLCMSKVVKASEVQLRLAALKVLTALVTGAGVRIIDCHPDILKVAAKYATDKAGEVRRSVAHLITAIAGNSVGCTSVSAELLLAAIGRGVEDDCVIVQDTFTRAVSSIYTEQIKAYIAAQELTKISLARGGPIQTEIPKPKRRLMSKFASGIVTQRKLVEDYQFVTVVTHLIKLVTKASSACIRASQVAILGHLVIDCLEDVDQKDMDWLIDAVVRIFADPFFTVLSHEEQTFFRVRMSHFFRTAITSNLSEMRQIALATTLLQVIGGERTEQELQYGLGELSHVLRSLGEAIVSVAEATHAAVTMYLRHPSFCVRSAAAHTLATSAAMSPSMSAAFHRTVLLNAGTQASQLMAYDGSELDGKEKNSAREQERMQRMYFFHGHTLALSIFIRNAHKLSSRMPKRLVLETLDFGLELLQQDIMNSSAAVQHIRCSLVRAGSLIVSSCLSVSPDAALLRLTNIIRCCTALFRCTFSPAVSDDMMMYELMSVEASAVCMASLIWCNSKVLIRNMDTLPTVIEGLEIALKAVKGRYLKFKSNYRYRTLHVILLECFSWLPPGSCTNSSQSLFVEGLKVLRDSISAGLESSCLLKAHRWR